jgi:hypothetical protein
MQRPTLAVAENAGEIENLLFPGGEQFLGGELGRGVQIERAALAGGGDKLGFEGMQVRLVAGRDGKRAALDLREPFAFEMGAQRRLQTIALNQQWPAVGVDVRRPPG